MIIELLVSPDCPNEQPALERIRSALRDLCLHDVTVGAWMIDDPSVALERSFRGSPTILIDGDDYFEGGGPPGTMACRLYATSSGLRGAPEIEDIRRAVKRAADIDCEGTRP